MKVTQIAELVNGITEQVLGKSAELTAENMKNIVDIGTQLTDSNSPILLTLIIMFGH